MWHIIDLFERYKERIFILNVRGRKGKASIKDVAQKSGFSTATVSHVINGTRYVSEEVTNKVQEAMKELNYTPNPIARSLRNHQSKLIGLIISVKDSSDMANLFFMAIAQGIEATLTKNGYKLLLCNSYEDVEIEKERIQMFNEQLVDGIIIAPTHEDYSFSDELTTKKCPIVFIDRKPQVFKGDCVFANNFQGAYDATKHLIERGHKQIGFIKGCLKISTDNNRLDGYRKALEENGIAFNQEFVKTDAITFDNGYRLAKELAEQNKVTAIFIANNILTMGAFSYFQENNIKIPEEMALVGFDDYEWTKIMNPPVTIVKQPAFEIGERAAEVILERIQNPEGAEKEYLLETKLIVRKSS